ncbi:MAG: DNA recombination protein RmuC [Candidatus Cloacimonetes bacterium]|nr:DNA recombination protein RmuC [Candidatus Cloacimonadota bacterium]MCF7813482.1 DNA recombination protein RmuC [Candidatus Cloacimonadota bacterium]MCF7868595.1 DNA recombination protein RmuC [Candidatus Cloacimonadota bacterium]MCF7883382.1 DNA recombination protein RmuC [Candidatus Cloacimonadota bacterium]
MEFVIIAAAIIIGSVIIGFFLKSKSGGNDELIIREERDKLAAQNEILREDLGKKESELSELRENNTNLQSERSKLETLNKNFQEKLDSQKKEIEELQTKFTDAFKNLANEILEEKTKKFTEQNRTNLDELLNPLKEKIKDFESKVEQSNEKNRISHTSLIEQIKNLKELNKKISDDANNLTKALKGDAKMQGNWGEVILERILEESGLRKGIEYDTQVSMTNEEGQRMQPDVVVKLPDNKHLIVDSKVSLVNYERMVSSESEEQKTGYLKALNISVKSHIEGLYKKHYHDLKDVNSPDFVFLFIPIEGVFSILMQNDSTVYQYALNKQIVIVSPSTLLATLRTISFIWRQENQTQHAMEIARQSGNLLDKFYGFLEDLEKIDVNLDRTKKAYDDSIKKLVSGKGNLISRVKKIEELGAKAKKQIPEKFVQEDLLLQDEE